MAIAAVDVKLNTMEQNKLNCMFSGILETNS